MKSPLNIVFFGSSLVSSYWNGAATYYRGILRALARRGHSITFCEPDALDRQQHRDIDDPDWARVIVYPADTPDEVAGLVRSCRGADLVIKASGVGAHDELLEAAVLELQSPATRVAFWDVDAPATLERLREREGDPFLELIPRYDHVFTYGGGEPVIRAYRALGARECTPIYNALDPDTHHPVAPDARFSADLVLLANRLPDREARVDEFFFNVAAAMPGRRFLLGGSGWADKPMPPNVRYLGHVATADHNALNATPLAVLNVSRESMARYGHSPATRVFEAAGAGACLITDEWEGIGRFLKPDCEILVARNGDDVIAQLSALDADAARAIGEAARRRVMDEHTYEHRIAQFENALSRSEALSIH